MGPTHFATFKALFLLSINHFECWYFLIEPGAIRQRLISTSCPPLLELNFLLGISAHLDKAELVLVECLYYEVNSGRFKPFTLFSTLSVTLDGCVFLEKPDDFKSAGFRLN